MLERFEEILNFAILHNSTDIHFEIDRGYHELSISARTINGFKNIKCHEKDRQVLEYLKYISNLNLIDEDRPQSGAFTYFLNSKEYFFRVATIKSHFLEVCVVRILNKTYIKKDIFKDIEAQLQSVMNRSNGMIIFSGPTGSGKTTSMYTLMTMYQGLKIYSIEDSIEIYFKDIVQVDVNKKKGFGYNEAISQVLRHDPDVICIGEIRDEDAARMAIRASYTGHLVICTLHATDCAKTLERLKDLGVSQQELEDNVLFIANQRLQNIKGARTSVYETIYYEN